ncbi:MAG: hypothetical protein JNM17_40910 [Archangium sp.]|nr:hypothetical protein [Archangium sp.]
MTRARPLLSGVRTSALKPAHTNGGSLIPGKRYQVFSIREQKLEKPNNGGTETRNVWVKAGSAFMNRDGSVNVYLDVLPIDGKLHVREPTIEDHRSNNSSTSTSRAVTANGSSSQQLPAYSAESNNTQFGGH